MTAERVEEIRCGLEAFLTAIAADKDRQPAGMIRLDVGDFRVWAGAGYFDPRMVLIWNANGDEVRNPYPLDGHQANEFTPAHAARMIADWMRTPPPATAGLTARQVPPAEVPPKKFLLTHETRITGPSGTQHTVQGTTDGQTWEKVNEWFEANPAPPPAVTDGQGRFINPPPPPDFSGLFVPPGDSETLRDQASDSRAKENASFGK